MIVWVGDVRVAFDIQEGSMTETPIEADPDPNTGAGLVRFLDAAIEKGWFNVSTAKALRTASTKILSVEAGWETADLRTLDIDHLFDRFRNLKHNEYSDDSMRIYKTRFTQAIKMHLGRLDSDPNWKSYGPTSKGSSQRSSNGMSNPKSKASGAAERAEGVAPASPDSTADSNARTDAASLMRFPFPLRESLDVSLSLPRDLTKDEAARLSAFISTLARDTK